MAIPDGEPDDQETPSPASSTGIIPPSHQLIPIPPPPPSSHQVFTTTSPLPVHPTITPVPIPVPDASFSQAEGAHDECRRRVKAIVSAKEVTHLNILIYYPLNL
jgi:hypothetical protein